MAKKQIKSAHCLNCNYHFKKGDKDNYCPECGQKNANPRISLGFIFKDALDNLFSLESKVLRTFYLLVTQPGVLTKFYNNGKRIRFITPVRLYITLSAICFLLITALPDNYTQIFDFNSDRDVQKTMQEVADDTGIEEIEEIVPDSLIKAQQPEMIYLPTLAKPLHERPIKRTAIEAAIKERRLDQMADSLEIKEWYNRYFFKQYVKLDIMMVRGKGRDFSAAFYKRFPVALFLMMPFVAFILKILFWRKRHYYVEHLVHSLHLHSFFFGIISLICLGLLCFQKVIPLIIIVLLFFLYPLQSIKVVYKQSYFRAFFNLMLLFFIYVILLAFTMILGMGLTFLLI